MCFCFRVAGRVRPASQAVNSELRRLYPTILTTAHVAEMIGCTIGDVPDKVHRGELPACGGVSSFASSVTKPSSPCNGWTISPEFDDEDVVETERDEK